MNRRIRSGSSMLLLAIVLGSSVLASEPDRLDPSRATWSYGDPASAHNSWSSNLRWAIDLSARHNQSLRGDGSSRQFAVGLDLHKVFQDENGDYGTLVFQPYFVKLHNVDNPPLHFDDGDDLELTWRMTYFNYTGLAQGKFNLRVGHFEVPFGLEENIDTNGTLRQYTFTDRGIKADWGLSLNGILEDAEYNFALSRGSGNDYKTKSDPYIFSGRIGTPSNRHIIAGLSGFYGEVLNRSGTSLTKRVGVDLAYYLRQWELLMELSGGETESVETANALLEASWRSPMEQVHLYTQLRQRFNKPEGSWTNGTRINVGLNYALNRFFDISGEAFHDIKKIGPVDRQTNLLVQLRMRI